jgi:hypothetical protein
MIRQLCCCAVSPGEWLPGYGSEERARAILIVSQVDALRITSHGISVAKAANHNDGIDQHHDKIQ